MDIYHPVTREKQVLFYCIMYDCPAHNMSQILAEELNSRIRITLDGPLVHCFYRTCTKCVLS